MNMRNLNSKNDGYQSENSRITLTEKQERLTIIQGKLKQLETDIERYTQLSKEGKRIPLKCNNN